MTPTPARFLDGKPQPGWLGFTMASASGSVSPGKWWSVMTTPMPAALAAATPSTLAMPLSTAIAGFEAVGHQEVDVCAHGGQGAQPDGASGGAVAVIVGHDQHFLAGLQGVGQHAGGMRRVRQAGGRQQRRPGQLGLGGVRDATGGPQAGEQGVDARGFQDVTGGQVGRTDG
ncbi:hypothetical protein G6F65_019206 [Rhizopus arrhizus]|nr:hypothetical protein G6F65_019206 [Rhizopus arrhizus]